MCRNRTAGILRHATERSLVIMDEYAILRMVFVLLLKMMVQDWTRYYVTGRCLNSVCHT